MTLYVGFRRGASSNVSRDGEVFYAQLSVFREGLSSGITRAKITPSSTRAAPSSMKSDSFLASRRSFSAVSTSRSLRSFWFSSRSSLFRRFRLMESEATSLILRSSSLSLPARASRDSSELLSSFRSVVTSSSCVLRLFSSLRACSSCRLVASRRWRAIGVSVRSVSYTHLTLPTSDLV